MFNMDMFFVCVIGLVVASQEYEGYNLNKYTYDSLCSFSKNAYFADTSNVEAMLAYAQTIDNVNAARNLYKKITELKTVPDSVRAEAYYNLSCMSYMLSKYQQARIYCTYARKFFDKDIYADFSMRNFMHNKNDSASGFVGTRENIKKNDSTASTNKSIRPSDNNTGNSGRSYFLQVGAFGEIENALGLKSELGKKFLHVSISAGSSGGKNIYRVRVGGFSTKEVAEAFADSVLVKKSIPFRVIEE
jgi:hypothetical protein